MKRKAFLRFWPVHLALAGIALLAILMVSATPAQARDSQGIALQTTPYLPTIPPSTAPAATLVVGTAGIPNTGGNPANVSPFSNLALWAVFGVLVIVLVIALFMRPTGRPPEPPPGPPGTNPPT